jgi:hypothetical protein
MEAHQYQAVAMNSYETSATVEDQGQVRVAGVPFATGTEVEVTISLKRRSEKEPTQANGEGVRPNAGLRWESNVLVHQGVGVGPSVAEMREDRLNRLSEG